MKKLLSMLAAVGLTATAAGSAVACSNTVKAKDVTVDAMDGTATFEKDIKLTKGTILVADIDDPETLVIIPYKLTNNDNITPFLGIIMKPEKDVKVDNIVTLQELNDALFGVDKNDINDVITKQIGTDNNAYMIEQDTVAKVHVMLDVNKSIDEKTKELSWTIVDLSETKDGYKIISIQDKVKVNLDKAYEPQLASEAETNDDKTFVIDTLWINADQEIKENDIKIDDLPEGIKIVSAELNDECQLVVTLSSPIEKTKDNQEFKLSWKVSSKTTLQTKLIVDGIK